MHEGRLVGHGAREVTVVPLGGGGRLMVPVVLEYDRVCVVSRGVFVKLDRTRVPSPPFSFGDPPNQVTPNLTALEVLYRRHYTTLRSFLSVTAVVGEADAWRLSLFVESRPYVRPTRFSAAARYVVSFIGSESVALAVALVLASVMLPPGTVVSCVEEGFLRVLDLVDSLSTRALFKRPGGQYLAALRVASCRGSLARVEFVPEPTFPPGVLTVEFLFDPLMFVPFGIWVAFDDSFKVVVDNLRLLSLKRFKLPVDGKTQVGKMYLDWVASGAVPDYATLRSLWRSPDFRSRLALPYFLARVLAGSLPTHHRLSKVFAVTNSNPELVLSKYCKLCLAAAPRASSDTPVHVLCSCPGLVQQYSDAALAIAPSCGYHLCPTPEAGTGICRCAAMVVLDGVTSIGGLHFFAGADLVASLPILHSFAKLRNITFAYTDGSWAGDRGGAGGVCVSFDQTGMFDLDLFSFSHHIPGCSSSSHAELSAIAAVIEYICSTDGVSRLVWIFCDSTVAISWVSGYSMPALAENIELLARIRDLIRVNDVSLVIWKVKGHNAVPGNEEADRLARAGLANVEAPIENYEPAFAALPDADIESSMLALLHDRFDLHPTVQPRVVDDNPAARYFAAAGLLDKAIVKGGKGRKRLDIALSTVVSTHDSIWKIRCDQVKAWERQHGLVGKWWKHR